MIWSYGFSKFLHFLNFRGQGIHFPQFHKATMFEYLENPGQLPVSQVLKGTDDRVLWILEISSFLTFPGL